MKWPEQVKQLLQKAEMDIIAVEELLDSSKLQLPMGMTWMLSPSIPYSAIICDFRVDA